MGFLSASKDLSGARERHEREQHVHRPGANVDGQAAAAGAAVHLLGNADLGHLCFKWVPSVAAKILAF